MTSLAKEQLLAALADVGVEPADYALIEQARALVDEVNARLRTRGSRMIYLITFCNATPIRQPDLLAVSTSHPPTSRSAGTRPPRRGHAPFTAAVDPADHRVAGTFLLVTVAAGVIITTRAAIRSAGRRRVALARWCGPDHAWGPLSGLHINPAVTLAFLARRVFPMGWVIPYWAAQFAGARGGAAAPGPLRPRQRGRHLPDRAARRGLAAFVMEILLTATLVSVILNTATGHRSIGHNAAIAVGSTVALLGCRHPDQRLADESGAHSRA